MSNDLPPGEFTEEQLLLELLARKRSRRLLIDFTQYTNPAYVVTWFHREIANALEMVERREIQRLLIEAPPRHGKSELATRRFVSWYMGKNPEHDVISASYGQDLSLDFSREIRDIIKDRSYQNVFPGVTLHPDSQAANRWHVVSYDEHGARRRPGGFVAASKATAVTGRGANLFNLDDMTKDRLEVENEDNRKKDWAWYTSVANTRLMPGAIIVATMTRWHEEDILGKILMSTAETGEVWTRMSYPATSNGSGMPMAPNAKALWPERYDSSRLEQIRRLNEYDWWALYMQRPRPPGGSFFSESDLLISDGQDSTGVPIYKPVEDPVLVEYVFAIIDSALKTGKEHDGLAVAFFARSKYGVCPYPLYVLDYDYKQVQGNLLEVWLPTVFKRLEELAKSTRARRGSFGAWIEDKGSGTVLLQQGRNKEWNVHEIESGLTAMGKEERAVNASPYVSKGNVKFTSLAYNRAVTYKGVTKNHLWSQVMNFRAGGESKDPDDCLDTFTYGVALSLGNYEGF